MILFLNVIELIFVSLISWTAFAAPSSLTYQGRILKSDGTPLESKNVSFIFQITNPSGSCIIYQEQVTGYSMVNSGGVFDIPIGNGTVDYPLSGGVGVLDVFNNSTSYNCGDCTGYTCADSSGGSFNPLSSDGRLLRVQFHDGVGWKTISPDAIIRSVPYAGYALSAQKLGTNSVNDFILKSDVNNSGSGTTTCDSGNFITWNADTKKFGCAGVTGSSGGTVKTVNSASSPYLDVSVDSVNPAITLNVGTTSGTVAAGNDARFTDARTPKGAAGGVLTGNYPNPGLADGAITTTKIFANPGINRLLGTDSSTGATITPMVCGANQLLTWNVATGWQCTDQTSLAVGSASLAANFSGNLAGDVTGTQGATHVDKIKGYSLNFSTAPVSGQFLKFNGTDWVPADVSGGAGIVTSVTSANTDISIASTTTTPVLTLNSGTAGGAGDANKIAKLDASGLLAVNMLPNYDTSKLTSGTLPIARGGTNSSTALNNNRVMTSSGGSIVELAAITANRAIVSNASGLPVASATTDTELGYLSGVTSSIQTQLSGKSSSSGWTSYSVITTSSAGTLQATSGSVSGSILQYSATGPAYSTASYPISTSANQLLYSSSNNVVGGLATTANSILTTNGSGVPTWSGSAGDLFSQYALLAGRGSGQTLYGGTSPSGNLTLESTSDATKGYIILGASGGKVGIGNSSPAIKLDVSGAIRVGTDATACAAGVAGAIRYNGGNVEYCNGSAWTALAASGGGITSLNGLTGNTQTFATPGTSGTAPSWSSAGSAHTLNIPMASTASVTAGLISKTDYDAFNLKLGTSSTFSGDVSGTSSTMSVDKIKGKTVSTTAPTSAQFLVYDGSTQYAPVSLGGDATMSNTGSVTIANSAVTNAKMANMAANTLKGNNTGSAAAPTDITISSLQGTTSTTFAAGNDSRITGAVQKAGDSMSGSLTHAANTGDVYTAGSGANTATIQGPSGAIGTSYVLRLPTVQGAATTFLQNDGSGNLSWVAGNSGSVTSVTSANSDISVATTTTTPVLTLNSGTAGGAGDANKIAKLDASGLLAVNMLPNHDTSKLTSGTLPIARGGTNSTTALNNNRVMVSSAGSIVETAAITANRAIASNGSGLPVASATTDTELGYLSGVTSSIQTQLNGKASSSGWTNYSVMTSNSSGALQATPGTVNGSILQYSATGPAYSTASYPTSTSANQLLYSSSGNVVGGLATASNSVLVTNGSGVPAWSGVSGDLFSQYALLAGRSGGQTINGGTAASENLTLDSTANSSKGKILLAPNGGNVGLGTSNPTYNLDILSSNTGASGTSVNIQNNSTGPAYLLLNATTGWKGIVGVSGPTTEYMIGTLGGPDGAIQFFTNNGTALQERMRLTPDGSVGLGIATPQGLLDIERTQNNFSTNGLIVGITTPTTVNGTYYTTASQVQNSANIITGVTNSGTVAGALVTALRNNSSSSTDDSGTLSTLIGEKITFGHGYGNNAAYPITGNVFGLVLQPLAGYDGPGEITGDMYDLYLADQTNGALGDNIAGTHYGIYQANYGSNLFNGTTAFKSNVSMVSAVSALSVATTVASGTPSLVNDSGITASFRNQYNETMVGASTSAPYAFWMQSKASSQSGTAYPISLNPLGGNVGIGTNNPTANLHVAGSALATAWNVSSDIRLKENIKVISSPLEKLQNLHGVEFDWRKDVKAPTIHDQTHDVGVIAQEVEKVFPEAVTTPKDGGYKSVAYTKLIAPLIEAVKSLYEKWIAHDKEIAVLKEQNQKMDYQIKELSARLEKMEKEKSK